MVFFWFRRDLRLNDNKGLIQALKSGAKVQPVFIFDKHIIEDLPKDDARITFIHSALQQIDENLKKFDSSMRVMHGDPLKVWENLLGEGEATGLYFNHDYEPYAIHRDKKVRALFEKKNLEVQSFKDHVFFEKNEITKADGLPYTIYTPYKNKWLSLLEERGVPESEDWKNLGNNFQSSHYEVPTLKALGFKPSTIQIPNYDLSQAKNYDKYRDYPAKEHTTQIGHHLRFGTISVRALVTFAKKTNAVFLSEIIWRDFFSQILYHFPKVVNQNFRAKYNGIRWRNNEEEFEKWCNGETGYPIVDAGMRQLNATGFMHNRVRMIVASFLVKDLLIDWQWGEAYFAEKLLDYDLASNNGNWQWAAGTGCDAAPYFRIFNPTSQQEKFDPELKYIRKWIPEFDPENYLEPIVDHKLARQRTLDAYKLAIENNT